MVALLADGVITRGMINLNGGQGNADGAAGYPGSLYVGPKSSTPAVALSLTSGTLILDTGGSWSHSSGLRGKGQVTSNFIENAGSRFGYSVCRFQFTEFSIGSDVVVDVRGENALFLEVSGNVSVGSDISLDGKTGQQGIYSGKGGPGDGHQGASLRNTEEFSNLHPALNGQGPGGGRGYEIGKSTGGGSYGGVGTWIKWRSARFSVW